MKGLPKSQATLRARRQAHEADQELAVAALWYWYEERQPGLGDDFLDALIVAKSPPLLGLQK